MSILLEPANLEADAVVPQCLDNQYVADDTFSYMIAHGVDYTDPVVSNRREQAAKTEFIRSLVYSSQVIVQRAFLNNSHFLYKNYLPQDRQNVTAFAHLIRNRAIVPFLFQESSLTDNLQFDLSREGGIALQALLEEVGDDLACVRLAVDDKDNEKATRAMIRDFSKRLYELNDFQQPELLGMASELFNRPDEIVDDPEAWKSFTRSFSQLAAYAFTKAGELRKNNQFLSRNQVYKDYFIAPDGDVALGQFRKPNPENPFIFELKKYVDLVYNTNLPDLLGRYTFTPAGLPSRTALQDSTGNSTKHTTIKDILSDPDYLASIRQTFMARSGKEMFLPELKEMSVADVVEVRELPEWDKFKETQAGILKDPLHCLNLLEQFQTDLSNFQLALSGWFKEKYKPGTIQEKYYNYASLGISVAGQTIVAGSDFRVDQIEEDKIPKKVEGYVAKLIVNVFDLEKNKIDKDRSYAVELMQTNADLERGEVIDLLRRITQQSGEGIPFTTGQIADQGID